jgi:hypothetical protein
LVIAAAFSILSADVWEAVASMRLASYLGLLALILALTAAFALLNAKQEIDEARAFGSWMDVDYELRQATKDEEGLPAAEQTDLERTLPRSGGGLGEPLGAKRWINVCAVLAVYQAFIFVPLIVFGTIVFWGIGRLAVRASVAGSWIYGDHSSAALANGLAHRPFFEQPWTRIALLLAAFSLLYVVIQVRSSAEQRKDFFRGADAALRRRFAMLEAYDSVVAPHRAGR